MKVSHFFVKKKHIFLKFGDLDRIRIEKKEETFCIHVCVWVLWWLSTLKRSRLVAAAAAVTAAEMAGEIRAKLRILARVVQTKSRWLVGLTSAEKNGAKTNIT